jgi:hypothetical protein
MKACPAADTTPKKVSDLNKNIKFNNDLEKGNTSVKESIRVADDVNYEVAEKDSGPVSVEECVTETNNVQNKVVQNDESVMQQFCNNDYMAETNDEGVENLPSEDKFATVGSDAMETECDEEFDLDCQQYENILDLSDFSPDKYNVEDSIAYMYKMALLHTSYGNYANGKSPPLVNREQQQPNVVSYFKLLVTSKKKGHNFNYWLNKWETIEVRIILRPFFSFIENTSFILYLFLHNGVTQYCIHRRFLLVDEEDELFVPFHLLMCSAISVVMDSYEAQGNPFTLHNSELLIWKKCNFNGSETWSFVCEALRPYVTKLNQYIRFVMVIPSIKSFLKVLHFEDYDRYIVSTLMSLECFMKYNMDIFCHYDLDVDVCGFTAHSLASGCGRCEDNYNMMSSDKYHDSNCAYYNKIQHYLVQQSSSSSH